MRKWLSIFVLSCLLAACAPAVVEIESPATPGAEVSGPAATPTTGVSTTPPDDLDVNATPEANSDQEVVLVLQQSGGIAGVQYVWTIYADGTITLADGPDVAAQEAAHVSAEQVRGLLAGLDDLGFAQFQENYPHDQCADCFNYTITVTDGGVTKSVTLIESSPDAPPELGQALSLIQALLPPAN